MYITDQFKSILHYVQTKVIRNLKLPPATVHFAPPHHHTTVLLVKRAALY